MSRGRRRLSRRPSEVGPVDIPGVSSQASGRSAATRCPWGVKVPRNLLFTRLWIELFPDLRFIHVIRHGLDMAYSGDTNQLRLYGDLVLTPEERGYARKLQAIAYWSRVNLAAASFGERDLGDRYLRLRFEDLCVDPVRRVSEIFDFLGVRDRSRRAQGDDGSRPSGARALPLLARRGVECRPLRSELAVR